MRNGLLLNPLACILIFTVLLLYSESRAQLIPDVCKIYFAGKGNIPSPVNALMQQRHDAAAEGCLDGGALHRYTSVSAVFPGRFDVCSYVKNETRIFDEQGKDVSERYRHDTQMFRAIGGPNCPAQDDPRYIPATNVSEGLFTALKTFADQLASSQVKFDAAFESVANQTRCGHDPGADSRRDLMELRAREYQRLRTGITTPDVRSRFRLASVGVEEGAVVMQGGGLYRECSGYALGFSDPRDGNHFWILHVEFTPEGLKVIGWDSTIA